MRWILNKNAWIAMLKTRQRVLVFLILTLWRPVDTTWNFCSAESLCLAWLQFCLPCWFYTNSAILWVFSIGVFGKFSLSHDRENLNGLWPHGGHQLALFNRRNSHLHVFGWQVRYSQRGNEFKMWKDSMRKTTSRLKDLPAAVPNNHQAEEISIRTVDINDRNIFPE